MKKRLSRLGLLLLSLVSVICLGNPLVFAAPSGVTGSATYEALDPGNRLYGDDDFKILGSYLRFASVKATNIKDGRLTRDTDKITVTLTNDSDFLSLTPKEGKSFTFTSAHLDVLDQHGNSLRSDTPKNDGTVSGSKVTYKANQQVEIPVDLTKLGTEALQLPIFVGVTYTSSILDTSQRFAYGFGAFNGDATAQASMKDVTVDTVNNTDKTITGTAEPNANMSVTVNGKTYTATADANGKYSLTLDDKLINLGDPDIVEVYESNDMGDTKTAKATVNKSHPVLSATKDSLTLMPDDMDDLKGSDSDVLAWIVKQAGITAKDSASGDVVTDPKYSSTDTALADKLAALSTNDSTTINVGATDSNGVKAPTDLSIKITKSAGDLQFTTVGDSLAYGKLKVPSATTLFAPTVTPAVEISDTRAAGSPWSVTASASDLTSSDKRTLNGQLMYVDAAGKSTALTTTAVEVASGQRTKGTNTVNVTKDWETQADQPTGIGKAGIYLQAQPNIYAGDSGTSYAGTVTWNLVDAPNK